MLGFWRPFVDGDHPSKVRTDLYLTDVHVNCFRLGVIHADRRFEVDWHQSVRICDLVSRTNA